VSLNYFKRMDARICVKAILKPSAYACRRKSRSFAGEFRRRLDSSCRPLVNRGEAYIELVLC